MVKLNLGCHIYKLAGFKNIDIIPDVEPDLIADVENLYQIEKESVDFIYAGHLLEHLYPDKAPLVIEHWKSLLKVGGRLVILVPNVNYFIAQLNHREMKIIDFCKLVYGDIYSQDFPSQRHHWIYDYEELVNMVSKVEWLKVERLDLIDNPPEEIAPFINKHNGISGATWQIGVVLTK